MRTNDPVYSKTIVQLLRGIVYREDDEALWQSLLKNRNEIMDYVAVLGLALIVSEDEGYGFLKNSTDEADDGIPKLITRRQLSYPVSLVLAILRKKFAEHDASQSDPRLILDRDDIAKQVEVFLQKGNNEVQWLTRFDSYINRIHELGFIRFLTDDRSRIEVRRVLKVFIDAQWLSDFDRRLSEYRDVTYGKKGAGDDDGV